MQTSFHTRENNFDFLRFFAAALVLFAHSIRWSGGVATSR